MRRFFVLTAIGLVSSWAAAEVVLQNWEMNDPAGSKLSQMVNRAGKARWDPKYDPRCARTDGEGRLRVARSSKSWEGSGVEVGLLPDGDYVMECRIASVDFSGLSDWDHYWSFGIQYKEGILSQLRVTSDGRKLKLVAFFPGGAIEWGTLSDGLVGSNLTVRLLFSVRDEGVRVGAEAIDATGRLLFRNTGKTLKDTRFVDTLRMEMQTSGFSADNYLALDDLRLICRSLAEGGGAARAISDSVSDDADGDGLSEWEERRLGTDNSLADTDGDGLLDGEEANALHTDPLKADTDGDGLLDGEEANALHTDPLKPDTDGDGLSDYEEIFTHSTDPRSEDTDSDGLSDKEEVDSGKTDPNDADSDDDGISDGEEKAAA